MNNDFVYEVGRLRKIEKQLLLLKSMMTPIPGTELFYIKNDIEYNKMFIELFRNLPGKWWDYKPPQINP